MTTLFCNMLPMGFELGLVEDGTMGCKMVYTLVEEETHAAFSAYLKANNKFEMDISHESVRSNSYIFTKERIKDIIAAADYDVDAWNFEQNTAYHIDSDNRIVFQKMELPNITPQPNPVHFYIQIEQNGIKATIGLIMPIIVASKPVVLESDEVIDQVVLSYFVSKGYRTKSIESGSVLVGTEPGNWQCIKYKLINHKRLSFTQDLEAYLSGKNFGVEVIQQALQVHVN